ncbi:MAG: TauD/TfdA family dioxygenase [Actinomycetota bacterium]|nr:TauD/TfdA family dioxygenase [Actinomycetota bacterium]
MNTALGSAPSRTLLTANIGAEMHGIALQRGVDDATVETLRAAVAQHHMVVLRDQFLTADQHAALASRMGPILASPVQIATGATVVSVSTIEDTVARPPAGFPWHTDVSWTRQPPALGFLSAVTIPATGGDTMWASTAALFDSLSPVMQERCERSTVLYEPDATLLASVERHHGAEVADRLRRGHPGVEHPLVHIHPLTGRKALYLSPLYAVRIVGPAGADGRLLEHLHAMLDDPALQVRWQWRDGDFVIWDERATCHRALTDHYPQRRVMRRCVTGTW